MRLVIRSAIAIILLFFIFSCNREEDVNDPVIVFLEPGPNFTVDIPDTFDVKVEIKDDRIIRSVSLSLVNEDKIPVIPSKYYYPDSPEFIIETSMIVDDKALTSGKYYLLASAYDGFNSKDKYNELKINEMPSRLIAYIAVTAPLSFKSTISRLDPFFETDTQFVVSNDFALSCVHSLWGKFFFIKDEPSVLTAYNTEDFEPEWEMAAAPPRPLITAVFPDKEFVFATDNGDAGILSEAGNVILRTAAYTDKSIQYLAADEKYIYASHVSLSGDIHHLTVYYRVTGAVREQKLMPAGPGQLLAMDGKLIVFLQSANYLKIMDYDPENFILNEIDEIQDENLKSVVEMPDDRLFLLTARCVIEYNLLNGHLSDFTDQPYDIGCYDPLSDIIFLVKGRFVFGFDRMTGELLIEKLFPEEVLDFQILYNK